MNLRIFFFAALIATAAFLSGCAAPPQPSKAKGPSPIYDEQGRPLWVPLPEGRRDAAGEEAAARETSPEAPEMEPSTRTDRTPPRIGSDLPAEPSSDDHLLAAVSSLEDQAERELSTGQVDRAFSTAERAIRIDPENAKIWNLLARIQLERSNFIQAEQLSRKSNLLSRGDRALQARNWRIIATSLSERGETAEAEKALRKAWDLE